MRTDRNSQTKERSNWRDEELSIEHRNWGINCPALDLDFVLIEFNRAKPVILVDYKATDPTKVNVHATTVNAMSDLASNHVPPLPFVFVYYKKDPWQFMMIAKNLTAERLPEKYLNKWLSKKEYVTFLYEIRQGSIHKSDLEFLATMSDEVATEIGSGLEFDPAWDLEFLDNAELAFWATQPLAAKVLRCFHMITTIPSTRVTIDGLVAKYPQLSDVDLKAAHAFYFGLLES